jgi:hypothetical protein
MISMAKMRLPWRGTELASWLGPAVALPETERKQCWFPGLLVALVVATVYIGLIVTIDNTNLGTTNGLWKAPDVSAWEHGTGSPIDIGEILYADAYGHLARLIPDSLLQYGTPAPDVIFRKMAILNGIFGGLASGLVFVLAFRFTRSRVMSAVISILHAGAGFILLNSINSEDIVPAYAFFLAATVFFFEYLHLGGAMWFALSALFVALATLFHWTVMAPALAAIGTVFALLLMKRRLYFWIGAAWLLLFCVFVQFLVLAALPWQPIPIWAVLYSAKANAGGWVGLFGEKFWYFLVGTGNYFSGANNLANYRTAFETSSILHSMILSWTVLAIGLAACVAASVRGRTGSGRGLVAAFAIALFIAGEAGAVYSQPQDPQMQIEPMFATILGVILLVGQRLGRSEVLWRRSMAAALAVTAAANGAWNIHLMQEGQGQDSAAMGAMKEQERLFPRERTVIVCQGFEGWTTWRYVLFWRADPQGWLKRSFHLARPFTTNRGISGAAAAAMMSQQIDDAFAGGLRVVASALWNMPENDSVGSFTTVTDEADARVYVTTLKARYRAGTRWNTRLGPFVELLPKAPEARTATHVVSATPLAVVR